MKIATDQDSELQPAACEARPLVRIPGVAPESDEEGLLQTCLATPDDSTPFLVYADWLEEQGHVEVAEFIRLDCAPRTGNQLNEERGKAWRRAAVHFWQTRLAGFEIGTWKFQRTFSRGLPTVLALTEESFERPITTGDFESAFFFCTAFELTKGITNAGGLAHAMLIEAGRNRRAPHVSAFVSTLANSQALARLTGLSFDTVRIGNLGAESIAASPYARHLTTLKLNGVGISDEAINAIAVSPNLRRLSCLSLQANSITDRGIAMLATSSNLAGLKSLNLGKNNITDAGVSALATSPHLGGLTTLNLDANKDITNAGAIAIACSETLAGLQLLDLGGTNTIGEVGMISLLASLRLRQLRSIIYEGSAQTYPLRQRST